MNSFSGTHAGSKIKPLIDNAQESVWLVSPWLGREYAKQLASLSQRGVEVRIITSKEDFNLESIQILKACENHNLSFLVINKEHKEKGVFIHSKIYLTDKKFGISGSANLTYSGLNTNVETLSIAQTPDEVRQMENDFMRLWLKYEKISLSKEALSSETSFSIRKALPLQNNNSLIDSQNVSKKALTFYPYYFFEYMFRGSVRSPPLLFEDRGYFVIDGVNSQLLKNFLTNELKDKPVTDYVLNTENKYTLELVKSKVEFHEARELALDHIIKRNTRQYTQEYGRNSYERLYVPKRYDVTFLKNYVAPVPIWNLELIDVDGLKHEKTVLGASGVVWKDMLYCPICKTKTGSNTIINCDQCGRVLCRNCIRESGFIFKKKLCPSCS